MDCAALGDGGATDAAQRGMGEAAPEGGCDGQAAHGAQRAGQLRDREHVRAAAEAVCHVGGCCGHGGVGWSRGRLCAVGGVPGRCGVTFCEVEKDRCGRGGRRAACRVGRQAQRGLYQVACEAKLRRPQMHERIGDGGRVRGRQLLGIL